MKSSNDSVLRAYVVKEGEDSGVLHIQQETIDEERSIRWVHIHLLAESVLVLQDLSLHLVINLDADQRASQGREVLSRLNKDGQLLVGRGGHDALRCLETEVLQLPHLHGRHLML